MSKTEQALREAILETQAETALGGHDIGLFEEVDTMAGGYEARCKLCQATTWVGPQGLRYSLLEDECPGGDT